MQKEQNSLLPYFSLPFINMTWAVAHNAFVNPDTWIYNRQQEYNIESQLEHGVRAFMINLHYHYDTISLCHETSPKNDKGNSCSATSGNLFKKPESLQKFLHQIHQFLNATNEIIILFLECYVPMHDVKEVFDTTGISKFLLNINPNNEILTIGSITKNNTRLIVFSDYAYGAQNEIPGFFYTKNHKETKYDLSSFSKCEDRNEDSRTKYTEHSYNGQKIHLFLLNHFYWHSISFNPQSYKIINSYDLIQSRYNLCDKEHSLKANFIAVDFINEGDWGGVLRFVENTNHNTIILFQNTHLDNNTIIFPPISKFLESNNILGICLDDKCLDKTSMTIIHTKPSTNKTALLLKEVCNEYGEFSICNRSSWEIGDFIEDCSQIFQSDTLSIFNNLELYF